MGMHGAPSFMEEATVYAQQASHRHHDQHPPAHTHNPSLNPYTKPEPHTLALQLHSALILALFFWGGGFTSNTNNNMTRSTPCRHTAALIGMLLLCASLPASGAVPLGASPRLAPGPDVHQIGDVIAGNTIKVLNNSTNSTNPTAMLA